MIKLILFVLISIDISSSQIPGGWNEANVTSKEVFEAAKHALDLYKGDDAMNLVLMDILNASQQVVSGMNYRIRIKNSISSCRRNNNFQRACFIDATVVCDLEIFVQSWTSTYNLTSFSCSNKTSSWLRIPTSRKIISDAATAAMRHLSKALINKDFLTLSRIRKAFQNIDMPQMFKVLVSIQSKCPPCVSDDSKYTLSKANLYLLANETSFKLVNCKTDSPILMSLTRCQIMDAKETFG